MSGATTELSLATAVDSDDNADYLTLSLATSLRTVDALFNNVTGHTHNGAHQGAPVPASTIPNGSISNAQLGPDVARANLLTNGGFEIWQRGNGPFTASSAYSADRWSILLAGSDALSVSKDTTNQDSGSVACAACTFSLGTGAGGSALYQPLMMSDGNQLRGRTVTLSVRVKTATANAVRLGGLDGSAFIYGSYHTGDGTYQTLSVTWTVGASATAANVGVFFAASCTAYIDNAMLVVGSQPADYVPLHPADDLARCLRYFQVIGNQNGYYPIYCNYAPAAAPAFVHQPYFTKVATTPTVTKNGTWTVSNGGQPSITGVMTEGAVISVTATAAGQVYTHSNGPGANLTIEANP